MSEQSFHEFMLRHQGKTAMEVIEQFQAENAALRDKLRKRKWPYEKPSEPGKYLSVFYIDPEKTLDDNTELAWWPLPDDATPPEEQQ